MHQDGYVNITNMDISQSAIDFMNSKSKHKSENFLCNFCLENLDEVGDCQSMKYRQHSFDVVIDKATLDCFYVTKIELK